MYGMIQKPSTHLGAYEKLLGREVSKVVLRLRVDKDVPWIHVEWVLTAALEQRFAKIEIAARQAADRSYSKEEASLLGAPWLDGEPTDGSRRDEATLAAYLPDAWFADFKGYGRPDPTSKLVEVQVCLLPRRKRPVEGRGKGGTTVDMATRVSYGRGAMSIGKLENVGEWVREAKAKADAGEGKTVAGQVVVGQNVPFKFVVATISKFHAAGVKRVWWYGAACPSAEVRALRILPYPARDWPTEEGLVRSKPRSPEEVFRVRDRMPPARQAEPRARVMMNQVAKVYASCSSYRDTGVAVALVGSETTKTKFKTAFVRPDRFRFEYRDRPPPPLPASRMIVWRGKADVRTWWSVTGKVKAEESLGMALAGARADMVVPLLMPGVVSGLPLMELQGLSIAGEGKVANDVCVKIHGEHPWSAGAWYTIWIEKDRHLIRKVEDQEQVKGATGMKLRTTCTTIYFPEVNVAVRADELAFAPPVGSQDK
jgi:hypothetical protein